MFIRKFRVALLTYILLILGWSCTKIDTTTLGNNLIPVIDNIHTFDTTFTVIANNFDSPSCDSVYRTDVHALGIIPNDPYFGKTTANMYFELKPSYYPFAFPAADKDSFQLDSAVLVLHYSYSYGDTLTPQKAQLYKLTDKFKIDTTYTTCNVFNYDNSELIGEQTFIPARLKDSVHAFQEDAANELRIKLSPAFAEKFITDSATIFKNDTTFTDFFKGFALVSDSSFGGNAINYFDLGSTDTRLAFYYRRSLSGVRDTSVVNFQFTSYSGEANSIIRQRNNSEVTNHLNNIPGGDSLIFIQTAPGTFAELHIPQLSLLSNRVIHRAELIADQAYSPAPSDQFLTAPVYLYLDTKDTSSNGTYIPIPCDFTTASTQPDFSYLGGVRKLVSDGSGHQVFEYVFNISRYVQSIVTKGSNNDVLRLRAPYDIMNKTAYSDRCGQTIAPFIYQLNNVADGAVKLNGTNGSSTRIRLHIIYSTL